MGQLQVKGSIIVDAGASKALTTHHKSLLPVGVKKIEGDFRRGEMVACFNLEGTEIARGLINYNANEAKKIIGLTSDEIEHKLVFINEPELIHKDNLIITQPHHLE